MTSGSGALTARYMAGYGYFPLVDLGCWHETRVMLDDAIDLAESGWWRAWPLQSRAWLNWLTGDIDEAERDLDEIHRLALELTEGQFLAAQAQAVAAVAIETEHWDIAVQTVADTVRQLPVEEGHPVVHWQTMTAVWLGLWAAAEPARERGERRFRLARSSSRRVRSTTCRGRTATARPAHGQGPSPPRLVRGGADASRAQPRVRVGGEPSTPSTHSEPLPSAPTRGCDSRSSC